MIADFLVDVLFISGGGWRVSGYAAADGTQACARRRMVMRMGKLMQISSSPRDHMVYVLMDNREEDRNMEEEREK